MLQNIWWQYQFKIYTISALCYLLACAWTADFLRMYYGQIMALIQLQSKTQCKSTNFWIQYFYQKRLGVIFGWTRNGVVLHKVILKFWILCSVLQF